MTEPRATYEGDEFNRAIQVAERLRQRQLDEIDRADLIAHLEDFAIARRCDVMNASLRLLRYLLTVTAQPGRPGERLRNAVAEQQVQPHEV